MPLFFIYYFAKIAKIKLKASIIAKNKIWQIERNCVY